MSADHVLVGTPIYPLCGVWLAYVSQEAKDVESWPNTTSAWAGWSRFDIPVDRYDGAKTIDRRPCTGRS
jgi:hypothetical protein